MDKKKYSYTIKRISHIFLLVFILIAFTSCDEGTSDQALSVLEKVADKYREMDHMKLEATITTEITAGLAVNSTTAQITYYSEAPGRIRIVRRGDRVPQTLISDGSTTWTYLPSFKMYKEEQSSPLSSSDDFMLPPSASYRLSDMGNQLTAVFKRVTDRLQSARLAGEETLSVNDKSRDVNIVEATYDQISGQIESSGNTAILPVLYWIDKENFTVWKKEFTMTSLDTMTGKNIRLKRTTLFEVVNSNPVFTEDTFTFTVPEGVEKVSELPIPDGNRNRGLVGNDAISFELTSVNGERISLDQFQGNIVILDFWATWCGPCLQMHPHLDKLQKEYKDDGLVVLGINSESPQRIADYMKRNEYSLINLIDLDHRVSRAYQVSTIPSLFIINRDGKIYSNLVGYKSEERIREAVNDAGI